MTKKTSINDQKFEALMMSIANEWCLLTVTWAICLYKWLFWSTLSDKAQVLLKVDYYNLKLFKRTFHYEKKKCLIFFKLNIFPVQMMTDTTNN